MSIALLMVEVPPILGDDGCQVGLYRDYGHDKLMTNATGPWEPDPIRTDSIVWKPRKLADDPGAG